MARRQGEFSQAIRCVKLLRVIEKAQPHRPPMRLSEIARETDASERQVRRDIAALQAAGEPITVKNSIVVFGHAILVERTRKPAAA